MRINILGADYEIIYCSYADDPIFEKDSLGGYCISREHKIVCCAMSTTPGQNESEEVAISLEKETLRHEILHAFLFESGLDASSFESNGAWAKNEEMIDWFALQGPKIIKAWREADAL